jgi:hypothetical protein
MPLVAAEIAVLAPELRAMRSTMVAAELPLERKTRR